MAGAPRRGGISGGVAPSRQRHGKIVAKRNAPRVWRAAYRHSAAHISSHSVSRGIANAHRACFSPLSRVLTARWHQNNVTGGLGAKTIKRTGAWRRGVGMTYGKQAASAANNVDEDRRRQNSVVNLRQRKTAGATRAQRIARFIMIIASHALARVIALSDRNMT